MGDFGDCGWRPIRFCFAIGPDLKPLNFKSSCEYTVYIIMAFSSTLGGPGFRFHPYAVELVMYYLKRKILGRKIKDDVISELDLYKFSPWELPEKAALRTGDLKWYFFCPRSRKFGNGSRTTRSTERGYWKATGKDTKVRYEERIVGFKKTLIFHEGRAPNGERTDWVMHEHRLEDLNLANCGIDQDAYVLCEIFKKSGRGPKNGSQYGAPFDDAKWADDLDVQDCIEPVPSATLEPIREDVSSSVCTATSESTVFPGPDRDSFCTPAEELPSVSIPSNNCTSLADPGPLQTPEFHWSNPSEDDMLALVMHCSEDALLQSAENGGEEECFSVDHFFDDLEDLGCLEGNILDGHGDPSYYTQNTVELPCSDDFDYSWLFSPEASILPPGHNNANFESAAGTTGFGAGGDNANNNT